MSTEEANLYTHLAQGFKSNETKRKFHEMGDFFNSNETRK